MTAVWKRMPCGGRMLAHPCEVCGSDLAMYGFARPAEPAEPSRWYCREHRAFGERWLRGGQ